MAEVIIGRFAAAHVEEDGVERWEHAQRHSPRHDVVQRVRRLPTLRVPASHRPLRGIRRRDRHRRTRRAGPPLRSPTAGRSSPGVGPVGVQPPRVSKPAAHGLARRHRRVILRMPPAKIGDHLVQRLPHREPPLRFRPQRRPAVAPGKRTETGTRPVPAPVSTECSTPERTRHPVRTPRFLQRGREHTATVTSQVSNVPVHWAQLHHHPMRHLKPGDPLTSTADHAPAPDIAARSARVHATTIIDHRSGRHRRRATAPPPPSMLPSCHGSDDATERRHTATPIPHKPVPSL